MSKQNKQQKNYYELFKIIQIGLGIIGIGLLIAILGYILTSSKY